MISPLIDIALSNSKVTAAAWTLPGQADGVVVLPLGYGRMFAGYSGTNKGFNANVVRVSNALWVASGGKITKTGDDYPLACTQYHFNMEGRKILSAGTLEEYKKNPAFAHEGDETPPKNDSLYKEFAYPGYAWGMAIDLKNCNGCNACVVACGGKQHPGRRQRSGDARPRNALDPHRPLLHGGNQHQRSAHRTKTTRWRIRRLISSRCRASSAKTRRANRFARSARRCTAPKA